MFCPECGMESPDDANFCEYCGTKLAKKVSNAVTKEVETEVQKEAEKEMETPQVLEESQPESIEQIKIVDIWQGCEPIHAGNEKTAKAKIMKIALAAVAGAAVLGGLVYINLPGYQYKQAMQQAQRSFTNEKYEEAVKAYRNAYQIYLDKDKKLADAALEELAGKYDMLITECMEKGEYVQAQGMFRAAEEAIEGIAGDYELTNENGKYVWLADDIMKLERYCDIGVAGQSLAAGEYEQACEKYESILNVCEGKEGYEQEIYVQAESGLVDARMQWAQEFMTKKNYGSAVEQYDALIEKCPKSERAYIGKSNIYLYQDDIPAAVEVLKANKTVGDEVEQRLTYVLDNTRMVERKERDSGGATEVWNYDEKGYLVKNASGNSGVIYHYDELGRLQQKVDAGGDRTITTTYTFDVQDRLAEEKSETRHTKDTTNKDITTKTYAFYDNGQKKEEKLVVQQSNQGGTSRIIEESAWDEKGRPRYLHSARQGYNTDYTYSSSGALLKVITTDATSGGLRNAKEYSENGTLLKETDSYGTITYNALGIPLYEGNQRGNTTFAYNEAGELIAAESDNDKRYYEYDDKHRLIRYTRFQGNKKEESECAAFNYNGYMSDGIGREGETGYKEFRFEYHWDDQNRLMSVDQYTQVQKLSHEKKKRYTDRYGVVHSDPKGMYVPKLSMDEHEKHPKFQYESCSEQERIASVWDGADGPFGEVIGHAYQNTGGVASAPYYQFVGNWKRKGSGSSKTEKEAEEKRYYGDVFTKEAEKITVWNSSGIQVKEKNSLGDPLEIYWNSDIYKYSYIYQFDGEIE